MPYKFLSEYFSFTKKERIGIITILMLIVFFIFLPFLFPFFIDSTPDDGDAFKKEIAALVIREHDSSKVYSKRNYDYGNDVEYRRPTGNYHIAEAFKHELFYFDPNTLTVDGWKRLGIKEKTINTIQNYLSKGGKFYTPDDIGKIWGLHEVNINRLKPFIRIEMNTVSELSTSENAGKEKAYNKPFYRTIVDINLADTADLINLPGIGRKLANRMLAFRDKLGGFHHIEQVAETYALPDSTFQKIKDRLVVSEVLLRKININTATVDELKQHPYINYSIANAIVQYRIQHGSYSALIDLKNILIITDDVYYKLVPYLSIN